MGAIMSRRVLIEMCFVGAGLLGIALYWPIYEVQLTSACVFLIFTLLPTNLGPYAMLCGDGPLPKARTMPKSEFCPTWEEVLGEENLKKTGDHYLVVGGAGFVGRRVVHALVSRGDKVSVLDFEPTGIAALQQDYPSVRLLVGDVTKEEDCKAAVKDIDTIYAVFATIRYQDVHEKQYPRSEAVNVRGTRNLLNAAMAANVKRYIVTSTSHVCMTDKYGVMKDGIDESSPYAVRGRSFNNYGISKAECESMVLSYNGKSTPNGTKFATGSIRPSSQVYGFPDKLPLFGGAIKLGMFSMIQPDHWADNVTADSVILAELLLEGKLRREGSEGPAAGEAYNICGGRTMQDREFGHLIEYHSIRELGRRVRVVPAPYRLVLILSFLIDFFVWIMPGRSYEKVIGNLTDYLSRGAILGATAEFNVRSMEKAETILGYRTHVTPSEGIRRAMREFNHNRIYQSEKEWLASETVNATKSL